MKLPKSATGYTDSILELYDFLVLNLSSALVWRCRTSHLITLYRTHTSRQHLEVGVGTGYLLKQTTFPSHWVRLYLLDSNPDVLDYACRRLSRHNPVAVRCDLMQQDWPSLPKQQSIGMNYVWHALEGDVLARGAVFGRLADCLVDSGVLFGSSVVGIHPHMSRLGQIFSRHWLRLGFFNNLGDCPSRLEPILQQYFTEVTVWQEGQVMFFVAQHPIRLPAQS